MDIRKREMCACPKCGGDSTRIEDYEMDFDCLWTEWFCPDCEARWYEYYTLIYDGYYHDGKVYDAEGKECADI